MIGRGGRLLLAAAAAAALAGCGGQDPTQASSVVRGLCQGRSDGPLDGISFRASDGERLVGVIRGEGDVGVVVAHGYGGSLCDELPLVDDLADRGYTVLAYDARGFGSSPIAAADGHASSFSADVEGAVALLRERNIRTIALVGDSFGGTTVVAAAPLLEPRPAAVVSISGPPSLAGSFGPDLDAVGRARRLTAPLLYLVSEHDPYVALADARKLVAGAPSKDKRLLVYPGSYHAAGGLFVEAPYRERPYRAFIAFLASRTGVGEA